MGWRKVLQSRPWSVELFQRLAWRKLGLVLPSLFLQLTHYENTNLSTYKLTPLLAFPFLSPEADASLSSSQALLCSGVSLATPLWLKNGGIV